MKFASSAPNSTNESNAINYLKRQEIVAEGEIRAELEAFRKIADDIGRTNNSTMKEAKERVLNNFLSTSGMRFTYMWSESMVKNEAFKLEKQITSTNDEFPPFDLFWALEDVLAASNSSGKFETHRYPLSNGRGGRISRSDAMKLPPFDLTECGYQFGTHRFHAAHAIQRTLKLLEERYDIKFKELEGKRVEKI